MSRSGADDGVQDPRFKYQIADEPVTVTAFMSTSVPRHSFEYFASCDGKLDILGESGGAAESLVGCLCQKQ